MMIEKQTIEDGWKTGDHIKNLLLPVFLEIFHDVATMLARELSMIILDVTFQRHLVAEHARTIEAGMLFCAVEIFLQETN